MAKNYTCFFLNIHYNAHYYPTKFEIKIQLVYVVKKRQIVL